MIEIDKTDATTIAIVVTDTKIHLVSENYNERLVMNTLSSPTFSFSYKLRLESVKIVGQYQTTTDTSPRSAHRVARHLVQIFEEVERLRSYVARLEHRISALERELEKAETL